MPNHCENIIEFTQATTSQLDQIRHELCTYDTDKKVFELDFNKAIPQPYPMVSVAINDDIIKQYSAFYHYFKDKINEDKMREILNDNNAMISYSDKINMMASSFIDNWYTKEKPELTDDQILPNWYDWNIDNWGTKWNAYDTELSDTGILFYTAWESPSDELLVAIYEKLKNILTPDQLNSMTFESREEGNGYYKFRYFSEILKTADENKQKERKPRSQIIKDAVKRAFLSIRKVNTDDLEG